MAIVAESSVLQNRSYQRLYFIDNLRWTMIVLVISMHAADTYSGLGSWYFVQVNRLSTGALLCFAAWQMYLQAFFMGLLFFIAGSFVPSSLLRKGRAQFAWDRVFRLGTPVLFYMFVLGPVIEFYLAESWTSTSPTSFGKEWLRHIRNGQFVQENGPLWFCLALLIFSLVAAYFGIGRKEQPTRKPFPSDLQMILFAITMAALTFVVRLSKPIVFLNMHFGDFPQYILMFSAGVAAGRFSWLQDLPVSRGVKWLVWTMPAGFAAWVAIIYFGGALEGKTGAYSGGWHWQSAALNVWESFTCVGVSVGLLVLFRERFHSRGRVAAYLSDNAFAVYVFHPLILIAAARLLFPVELSPLLKFVVLTVGTTVVTFALSGAVFRRIPMLRNFL